MEEVGVKTTISIIRRLFIQLDFLIESCNQLLNSLFSGLSVGFCQAGFCLSADSCNFFQNFQIFLQKPVINLTNILNEKNYLSYISMLCP